MSVIRRGSAPSFANCRPKCEGQYHRLINLLDYSIDANGRIYPPNLDIPRALEKIPVDFVRKSRYEFEISLKCGATLRIDKPSTDWIVGDLACGAKGVDRMAALESECGAKESIPPVHPGEFLNEWISENRPERVNEIVEVTDLSRDYLENVLACKSPINEEAALELSKIFGAEAELWFRMQFAYDIYQQTGHEPDKSELPELMRRVPTYDFV